MFDVICVGSNTVDVFANTKYSEIIKIKKQNEEEDLLAYPVGGKILIEKMNVTTGGGGTNVAAALSKLGYDVAYLGCLGKCSNSSVVLDDLKKFKINTKLIIWKEGQTGYSIILDSIEHDRTILTFRGVNNNLDFKDIDKKKIKTKWFYFSAMLERSFITQKELAKFAEKQGIKIAFNPSSYLAEKGAEYLKEILSRVEILILNKEEAQLLSGLKTSEVIKLAVGIEKFGPKYVVITDGEYGSYCLNDGFFYHAKAHKTRVVESTGAGDAFASTFLAGIMRKKSVEYSMGLATINSESVITHHGAKAKLLTLKEALTNLKRNPVIVIKQKI